MKMWLKRWWKPLALLLVLAGFLLYPPMVLTEVRVDFEKEDYSAGNHCKLFASPTENLGLDSVKNAYKKPGRGPVLFLGYPVAGREDPEAAGSHRLQPGR